MSSCAGGQDRAAAGQVVRVVSCEAELTTVRPQPREVPMSDESIRSAGILLLVFPTVVFGGASLLWHWITRQTAYYDHELRRSLWRAGHAHAGVLLILALVALLLVDHADLGAGWKQVVRTTFPVAALLLPIAYFLSVVKPDAERPNRLVNLAYVGGISLTIGMLTLGLGLLRAA
jgi:hypothetical protein